MARGPVTAEDVERAVQLAIKTVCDVPDADWGAKAGSLEWTCWETVEHIADSVLYYGAQTVRTLAPTSGPVPMLWTERRPGGPHSLVAANPEKGKVGLLQVLDACGGLLAAAVRTASPAQRAHHAYGRSDPEGFAAMGVVETVVHTHDVAEGLGVAWTPPAGLCARVLRRLFPDAPADTEPWTTLLWATGRGELAGHGRVSDDWEWDGTPPGESRRGPGDP